MNVFEAVKNTVTTRQAAEMYGFRANRAGMIACPFHNDRTPSMKVDKRFHCFGCGADGDAVDFVSRLFGLPSKEAAMKLADDFGISYNIKQKPTVKPRVREPTPEQTFKKEEAHTYRVLSDYFHLLRRWENQYAPKQPEDEFHPLFVEALQRTSYIEYLLDILLVGSLEERQALVAEHSEYTCEALRIFMLGAIHRVFKPGCKFEVMLCLVGGQGAGKSTFFRLLAVKDEWFSDDLRKIDDDNVYRKMQGHWIIEMSEMIATANAKSIEEIKSFISRPKETYKVPYETHPADRLRQCVFGGSSNTMDFLPLD